MHRDSGDEQPEQEREPATRSQGLCGVCGRSHEPTDNTKWYAGVKEHRHLEGYMEHIVHEQIELCGPCHLNVVLGGPHLQLPTRLYFN